MDILEYFTGAREWLRAGLRIVAVAILAFAISTFEDFTGIELGDPPDPAPVIVVPMVPTETPEPEPEPTAFPTVENGTVPMPTVDPVSEPITETEVMTDTQ